MPRNDPRARMSRSSFALMGAATLTAAALVVFPGGSRADAATFEVTDFASWNAALAAAMTDGGATTINITADFAADGAVLASPNYSADEDLTVVGNGHTVTWSGGTQGGFLVAHANRNLNALITIEDLTVSGFATQDASGAVVIRSTVGTVLDHVTIADTVGGHGLAVTTTAPVRITASTFTNNAANPVATGGGAVQIGTGGSEVELTVAGSAFTGNSASVGGAISMWDTSGASIATITDSIFENNVATQGGAIYTEGSATITDSTFATNRASSGFGGGVSAMGDVSASGSTFIGNSSSDFGGAILAGEQSVTVASTFEANTSVLGGGAVAAGGLADNYGSTFIGNSADFGGAVYSQDGGTSLQYESTFASNSSRSGGAVYSVGEVAATLSTFEGNTATVAGIGNGAHIFAETTIRAKGSVFTNALGRPGCSANVSVVSAGYSVDGDGSCTAGLAGVGDVSDGGDAQMGAIADNGGPTLTIMPAAASPAVDLIPLATCEMFMMADHVVSGGGPANGFNDQRGVPRDQAVTAQGGACDAGAVELLKDFTFPISSPNGVVTFTVSGAISYRLPANGTVAGAGGTPPAGVVFPCGTFAFTLLVPFEGGSATVTAHFPSAMTSLWKTGDATWATVAGTVFTDGGQSATYTLTDGAALDEDGTLNSEIADPVAPGIGATFTG